MCKDCCMIKHCICKSEFNTMLIAGLETLPYLNLPQNDEDSSTSSNSIHWPRRMRNHCKHLLKNMHGRDLYEMWLRTSVGEGHR